MKWLWRYLFEDQLMWKRVVGAKYEAEDSWMTKDVTSPYGVSLWRSIRELWEEVKFNSKVKVGNRNKTKFWQDEWHESGNLKLLFPDIYNLVLSQQRTIAEIWTTQGWNFRFKRHLNDWEVMRVAEFLNIVGNFNGLQAEEDALWWKSSNKGIFKAGAAYRLMEQPSQQIPTWPWRQIWKGKIPYKVSCFIWLLAKEAALTQDNVMKRGITLCSRCFLCGETSETVHHLFLHCKFTQQLWRVFLSLKGISWAMPRRITEALKSWEEAGVLAKDKTRWRIIPASIWWAT